MPPSARSLYKAILGIFVATAIALMNVCPGGAAQIVTDHVDKEEVKKEAESKIPKLTVTAQKREESLQDVPISISAFTGAQLDEAGIINTKDLVQHVPNVYLKYAEPENTIIIRGVTSFHSSIYAPAGFYVDDVSFPLQYMHNMEFLDIERVEVLKGPQGTLYGRNTESGVINVVTRQPGNDIIGKLLAEYGNYNRMRFSASASGPIIEDKLFLGVAAQKLYSDGFYTNIYNDDDKLNEQDHLNVRANLRWTPSDKWDIALIADVLDYSDGYGCYRFLNGPMKTDRHELSLDYPTNHTDQSGDGQTLRVKYSFDSFDILSVTSNRSYNRSFKADRDGTPQPSQFYDFSWDDSQQSQEIRLYSTDEKQPLQWLFGLYGFWEDVYTINNVQGMTGALWDNRTEIESQGYAAFTHLTYSLWERLHLTVGLRFDHHDLDGTLKGAPSYLTPSGQKLSEELSYDELLPKFAVSYDFTDKIMCYATVAKGYLIGGYNYVSAYSQTAFTYDPEYTWNYELGIKTSWFDDRLLLNAAIYYIDMQDKQVFDRDLSVPINGAQNITNAAKAHSVGGEIDLHARPVQGLDIFAGIGVTEAKFDEWIATESDGSLYDYEGKYLTYYPKYSANLGIQYSHHSGLFGRIDYFHTGEIYCDNKNLIKQDPYGIVNLRLGYMGESFELTLWGQNLFDEEYFTYMTHYGNYTLVVDGDPMTFGVTAAYRF